MESAINGIIITDATRPGHPIEYCNPAFSDMTGFLQSEGDWSQLSVPAGGRS